MGKADRKRTDGKVNKCIRGNLLLSVERSADDSRFIFLSGKSKNQRSTDGVTLKIEKKDSSEKCNFIENPFFFVSLLIESRRELCYYNTEYLHDFIRRSSIVYAKSKKAGQFYKGKNKR